MSSFVRVRAVDGPKHEFYAASGEVEANPDLYEVLDPEPVTVPGEVVYVVEPAKSNIQTQADAYLEGIEKGRVRAEKLTQKE